VGSATTLEYCELSDIGRRRSANQDAEVVLVPWSREQFRQRGWLFVVADGMGAHAAGETASALAVEHVPRIYERAASRSPPLALKASIEQANAEIHTRGEASHDLQGMGTTCTALAILPRGAIVGHVGDSRAYRVRGTTIDQLSRDHSLVWELEAQKVRVEEMVPRNIITRSLGPHPTVSVDLEGPFPIEENDVFVVCSDGLSGQVSDEEIGLLAASLSPADAGAALVGLALVRGAPDNVTLIVARAGEKEASLDAGISPWPLTDVAPAPSARTVPWRLLALAAASLLVALVANPSSDLMKGLIAADGAIGQSLGEGLAQAVAFSVAAVAGLLCIGSLLSAVLAAMAPSGEPVRVLPPGSLLGEGPYRTYDCAATEARLDGIVDSVESAADGLASAERAALLDAVATARRTIRSGDMTAAMRDTVTAVATYRQAVNDARERTSSDG